MEEEKLVQEKASETEEEETTKKNLFTWLEEHPKTTFWARFAAWTIFSWLLPCAFLVWRFDLFRKIGQIQIGGWGIVAIVITAAFVFTIIRYVKRAFSNRYSLIGQLLGGFCKIVIPLLAMTLILYSVRESINLMIQVMGCVTICEAIAIPLNPLPKWAYDAQKDVRQEERKDAIDYAIDRIVNKRGKKKESGDH